MYIYVDPQGNYPRYPGDIQIDNPGWEIGDPTPPGWAQVSEVEPPIGDRDTYVYEGMPTEIDGVLSQVWMSRPLTEEEIAHRDAPLTARQKLKDVLNLSDAEIDALKRGLI